MSTHEDIQEHYREQMRALGRAIDELFNEPGKPKRTGFCLLMFDFGESPTSERINYLSNAARPNMIVALKELVSRFEGRHIEETQAPIPGEQ